MSLVFSQAILLIILENNSLAYSIENLNVLN